MGTPPPAGGEMPAGKAGMPTMPAGFYHWLKRSIENGKVNSVRCINQ